MLGQSPAVEAVEEPLQEPAEDNTQVDSVTPTQPIMLSELSTEPANTSDSFPSPRIATVQLGDLSGHSVQDLAEHLPNIGIHFTCKKCHISCNQMSEVLAHFTDGNCNGALGGTDTETIGTTPLATMAAAATTLPPRRRGRPKKTGPSVPAFTVTKETEYEELPRIAAPAYLVDNPGGRCTRYSAGKIKRLDVLTLLGGRVKDEPMDEDEEYIPVLPPLGGTHGTKRHPINSNSIRAYDPTSDGPRKRGRPKKIIKLYEEMSTTDGLSEQDTDFPEGTTAYIPGSDNDGNIASVTIKTEGNAKIIVVNTFKASDFECDGEEMDAQICTDESVATANMESESEEQYDTQLDEGHAVDSEEIEELITKTKTQDEVENVEQDQLEKNLERDQLENSTDGVDESQVTESAECEENKKGDIEEHVRYVEDEVDPISRLVTDPVAGTVTDTVTGVVTGTGIGTGAVSCAKTGSVTTITSPKNKALVTAASMKSLKDKMERVRCATQRTVYSYTHSSRKKRQNKCKICKQRFFYTEDELKVHTECHANLKGEPERYNCLVGECDYSTTIWNRMLDHLITHEDYRKRLHDAPFLKNIIGNFSCPICKKKFERKNNMKGHISKVHYKQDRECEICHMTMTTVDDKTYKRHVEKCQNLLFQCSHCEYNTPVSANMRKHMKIHLGQGFTCEVCQAVFPSKQRYTVHREIHEKTRRQFMCENCGQVFVSQDAVKKHVVRFHTEVTTIYTCPHEDCNFTSKIPTDLKKHTASVHNKKFRCPSCPFQSNSTSAYEQHQEYHKPGRSYRCTYTACFYSGATVKQLANHISQVHKLSSKHECPVCHKFYKKKTHLARHLVVHTGDKPYVCLDCNLAFASHSTYYRHRQRTGHDAKREGIVSVPQNITIQYVTPQQLAVAEEDGLHELQYGSEQGFELEDNTVQYITSSPEGMVLETSAGGTTEQVGPESVIILENENGEQVTYLLKMGADANTPATMVTEDGVEMDAALAQQIQVQLQQLQSSEEVMEVVLEEEGIQKEGVVVSGEQVNVEMTHGEVMQEEDAETRVVYTATSHSPAHVEQEVEEGVEVQHVPLEDEDSGQMVEVKEKDDDPGAVGGQTVLLMHPDGVVEQTMVEQAAEEEGGEGRTLEQSWIQMTQEGSLMTSDSIHIQQAPTDLQEIQQVIYEESVVEVDNSHAGDSEGSGRPQYAIVLLPSSSASGDEPEAALSMLQLQSGSNVVISDEDAAQLLLQQQQYEG